MVNAPAFDGDLYTAAAPPLLFDMMRYASGVERGTLRPDGWAAQRFAAADAGAIEPTDVASMLVDSIAPSLDTTILGLGHLLWQLGRHPEQWAMMRADAGRVPRAIDEALRLDAPEIGLNNVLYGHRSFRVRFR